MNTAKCFTRNCRVLMVYGLVVAIVPLLVWPHHIVVKEIFRAAEQLPLTHCSRNT